MTEQTRMLYQIVEAARQLSVSRSLMYRLVAEGQIEVVHIGRRALITDESLKNYVGRLRATRGGQAA